MGLAARTGQTRVRPGPKEPALRKARVCNDHLAGGYGVRLYDSLVEKSDLDPSDDSVRLGAGSERIMAEMGIVLPATDRPVCRTCLDWSERRHHLAGRFGAALLGRFLELGWARRDPGSRAVLFNADGERRFLALTAID